MQRMKLEHSPTPDIKISSKWIEDLNVRPDTTNFLEENTGRTLKKSQQYVFDPPPRVMKIKQKETNEI